MKTHNHPLARWPAISCGCKQMVYKLWFSAFNKSFGSRRRQVKRGVMPPLFWLIRLTYYVKRNTMRVWSNHLPVEIPKNCSTTNASAVFNRLKDRQEKGLWFFMPHQVLKRWCSIPATSFILWRETEKDNTLSALTRNGVFVSSGMTVMRLMFKLSIIIEGKIWVRINYLIR